MKKLELAPSLLDDVDASNPRGQLRTDTHLDEGKTQTVRLEVHNAFGRQTYRDVKVERAKPAEAPVKMKVGER